MNPLSALVSPCRTASRREFLRGASFAAAGVLAPSSQGLALAFSTGTDRQSQNPSLPQAAPVPDYRIEIEEIDWEISPKKKIRTSAYGGQIPGRPLRLTEGKPVTIEIVNRLDHPEIIHWHGQWIPVDADGAMEEGSPMIPSGAQARVSFTPRPSGLHWYHTHAMSHRGMKHGLYTGQFGILMVDPATDPGRFDREQFIVLNDWEPYNSPSDDGSMMVQYGSSSINGRQLGHDAPIQVRRGEQVLFHFLNASATEAHWLTLPGHEFQVLALDGFAVATPAKVQTLRLGPAERVSALVSMNTPGVWILGEARASYLKAGMGTIVEYAGRSEKPTPAEGATLKWDYRAFGDASPAMHKPDVTIPLVFTSRFRGHGAPDQWMVNGKSFPDSDPVILKTGLRHRLIFDNRSTDDHPVHVHRHNFELVSVRGTPMSGVHKDVVIVEANSRVEADLLATNPGNTLFHCHQQDHMDAGFMALFRYA
jgi:FtsP/CotA-like multicopper oxidase with cupredoxin domain